MKKIDALIKKISEMKNPTVAGLDTRLEYLPECFLNEIKPEGVKTFEDAAEAIYAYNVKLVDALCDSYAYVDRWYIRLHLPSFDLYLFFL